MELLLELLRRSGIVFSPSIPESPELSRRSYRAAVIMAVEEGGDHVFNMKIILTI